MTDSVPKPKLIKKSVLPAPKVEDTVAGQPAPTTLPGSVPKPTPIKNPVPSSSKAAKMVTAQPTPTTSPGSVPKPKPIKNPVTSTSKAANKVTAQPDSTTSGEPTSKQPPKSSTPPPNKSQTNHPPNPNSQHKIGRKRFNRLRLKFSEYLQSGKRPPKELIDRTANEMQIPAKLIEGALKKISGNASLSRLAGFRVEKTYFELVHDWNLHDWNGTLNEFIEEISTRCDMRSSAVRGWLGMLHQKKFFPQRQELPTTDQQQTILALYNQYRPRHRFAGNSPHAEPSSI